MRPARIVLYTLFTFFIGIYCYAKKVERNPRYSKVFYKLAQDCGHTCSHKKLENYFKKAIYHDPNFSDAYFQLAVISELDGNYEEALKFYGKVTQLDSKNTDAYFKVGVDYFEKRNFKNAKRYFHKYSVKEISDIEEILASAGLKQIKRFKADGKTGDLNEYFVHKWS